MPGPDYVQSMYRVFQYPAQCLPRACTVSPQTMDIVYTVSRRNAAHRIALMVFSTGVSPGGLSGGDYLGRWRMQGFAQETFVLEPETNSLCRPVRMERTSLGNLKAPIQSPEKAGSPLPFPAQGLLHTASAGLYSAVLHRLSILCVRGCPQIVQVVSILWITAMRRGGRGGLTCPRSLYQS